MFVSNPSSGKLKRYAEKGMHTTNYNLEVLQNSEVVLLCVKPQVSFNLVQTLLQALSSLMSCFLTFMKFVLTNE